MPARDPYTTLRRRHRALVPVGRRRRHLVLLRQPDLGQPLPRPAIEAIVRPEERAALLPLIDRILSRPGHLLRIAEAEDGLLDAELLWETGSPVWRQIAGPAAETGPKEQP